MTRHAIQIHESLTFDREDCSECGVVYFVPSDMQARALKDGRTFYCPNGHGQHYTETERVRLKKELAAAQAEVQSANKRREWAEQEAKNARAEHALLKRRAHAGVCPCCHRTFANVARHMKTKHATQPAQVAPP